MADVHVRAVVDAGFWVSIPAVLTDTFFQAAFKLRNKVNDGGRAAKSGCFSAGVMVIRGDGTHHFQVEMNVRVDAARQNQKSAGIDDFHVHCLDGWGDLGDFFAFDQDISLKAFFRCNKGAIFDDHFHFLRLSVCQSAQKRQNCRIEQVFR